MFALNWLPRSGVLAALLVAPTAFAQSQGQDQPKGATEGDPAHRSFTLFIVGALIDISGNRSIAFCHWSGGMDGECHVETIERCVIISPALDMEDQRHLAHAFGGS